jgi:TPR repeat protein
MRQLLKVAIILILTSFSSSAIAGDIYEAAKDGDLTTVQALVTTNVAVVDARDADGNTPLLWAVKRDQPDVAKFLLSKGADPSITNKNGLSPLQMAKALGEADVLGLNKVPVAIETPPQIVGTNNQDSLTYQGKIYTGIHDVHLLPDGRLVIYHSEGILIDPTNLPDAFLESWGLSETIIENAKNDATTAGGKMPYLKVSEHAGQTASGITPEGRQHLTEWLQKAADGDADSQVVVGMVCYYGSAGKRDLPESVKWFRKAAEQGNAAGQYWLGRAYFHGEGVEEDKAEGLNFIRKAAEQGNPNAQNWLGHAYFFGEGVDNDFTEAVMWLRKAADQGNPYAESTLGLAYFTGQGVDKDLTEAVKWFRLAAEQGDADGLYGLGMAYYYGLGLDEDKAEGVKWLRKAAEQGNAEAVKTLKEIGY